MNLNVQLCYINWETKDLRILPSENIGDKKKQEKQEDSTWKCNGRILKDNKTFNDYNIEVIQVEKMLEEVVLALD